MILFHWKASVCLAFCCSLFPCSLIPSLRPLKFYQALNNIKHTKIKETVCFRFQTVTSEIFMMRGPWWLQYVVFWRPSPLLYCLWYCNYHGRICIEGCEGGEIGFWIEMRLINEYAFVIAFARNCHLLLIKHGLWVCLAKQYISISAIFKTCQLPHVLCLMSVNYTLRCLLWTTAKLGYYHSSCLWPTVGIQCFSFFEVVVEGLLFF